MPDAATPTPQQIADRVREGMFANDRKTKFLQQLAAAARAGVQQMEYHLFDGRGAEDFERVLPSLKNLNVGQLYALMLRYASSDGTDVFKLLHE